jgi:microcystin-dependent protein
MLNYNTKVDSNPTSADGNLTAAEFNNFISELENIITSAGITLSGADLFQIAKSMANYSICGTYLLDSGSGANAYVLSAPSPRQSPTNYFDGMQVRFFTTNANTGASTVNINALGVKNINRSDGTTLQTGDIPAGTEITITYRATLGYFILSQNVKVSGAQSIQDLKTFITSPRGGSDPSNANDLVRYSFLQSYVTANSNTFPAGVPVPWCGNSAPVGWLLCYGQAVSRTTYAALFTNIGTNFGSGDGSTTFNVPDLRGRTPFGRDDMGGTAANRIVTNGTIFAASGGEEKHTLTQAEVPPVTFTYQGGTSGHTASNGSGTGATTISGTTDGGGGSHNNMPPYMILNYIIKT